MRAIPSWLPQLVYGSLAALRLGDYRAATSFGKRTHVALPVASPDVPVNFVLEPQSEVVLSYVRTLAGDFKSAALHRDNALAASDRRSSPYDRAVVFDALSLTMVLADDARSALTWAEQGIAHDTQFGFDGFLAVVSACRACALCRLGSGSVAEYASCLRRRAQTADHWYQSVLLAYLAETYLQQGELSQAAATMPMIDPEPAYEAEILRVRGDILQAQGRNAEARTAKEQGAGLFEQRAAAHLRALKPPN